MTNEEQIEHAWKVLEMYGVSKERARYIGNGIDILVSRMDKEIKILEQSIKLYPNE